MSHYKKRFAIFLGVCLIIFVIYAFSISKFNNEKTTSKLSVDEQPESNNDETAPTAPVPGNNPRSFLDNLNPEQKQKDASVSADVPKNFILTTSILSHSKDKAVYAAISECVKKLFTASSDQNQNCSDWRYKVFVKDLGTGTVKEIFNYSVMKGPSLYGITLINIARAGGCPLVPFPIAWSLHDVKIVLEAGVPTPCGSGGGPRYSYYSLDATGGELSGLGGYDPRFIDSAGSIIYTDLGSRSPRLCGPAQENNSGRIIYNNIETGEETTLKEDPDTYYELAGFDSAEGILSYTARPSKRTSEGCGEIDFSASAASGQMRVY